MVHVCHLKHFKREVIGTFYFIALVLYDKLAKISKFHSSLYMAAGKPWLVTLRRYFSVTEEESEHGTASRSELIYFN